MMMLLLNVAAIHAHFRIRNETNGDFRCNYLHGCFHHKSGFALLDMLEDAVMTGVKQYRSYSLISTTSSIEILLYFYYVLSYVASAKQLCEHLHS